MLVIIIILIYVLNIHMFYLVHNQIFDYFLLTDLKGNLIIFFHDQISVELQSIKRDFNTNREYKNMHEIILKHIQQLDCEKSLNEEKQRSSFINNQFNSVVGDIAPKASAAFPPSY